MILENKDRKLFIRYLQEQNENDRKIIEQLSKLNIGNPYEKKLTIITAARSLIINELSRTEEQDL